MNFTSLGLSDQILRGVEAKGYSEPTPIQALAVRPAAEGRDIIGCAQTGTGKTAAFVLPMLHRLSQQRDHQHRRPRGLVLTPTRELAIQVQRAVAVYGRFLTLRSGTIYGGAGVDAQIKQLRQGLDIVIATPGRLQDHMERKTIDLSHVQILVLDEADRMLDMGFIHDVRRIVAAAPKDRQTMLFSATLSAEVHALAKGILRNPHTVETGESRNPATTITQYFYSTESSRKMELLTHMLGVERMESVLVFARTKHGADKIARRLERKGIGSTAIHSNRSQPQRLRALEGFRKGKFRVLVATDIAARGIDVDGISHVINYDVPRDAKDYVHRIGRTGRAGSPGDAITLIAGEERQLLKGIEKFTGTKIHAKPYDGFSPDAAAGGHQPQIVGEIRAHEQRPQEPRRSGQKRNDGTPGRKKKAAGKMTHSSAKGESWSNH